MNDIGKKIKELRIGRKMTQTEVVGHFITRNMLSQIENGTALPSMRTLNYLARIFGVPISALLDDDSKLDYALPDIHAAIAERQFNSALAMIECLPDFMRQEIVALKLTVYYALAQQNDQADTAQAVYYAKLALDIIDEDNTYYRPHIKAELTTMLENA